MKTAQKRRKAANDPQPVFSQKMSCISLSRPALTGKKIASLGVLLTFIAILGIGLFALLPTKREATQTSLVRENKPYDITVDAFSPDVDAAEEQTSAKERPPQVMVTRPLPPAVPQFLDTAKAYAMTSHNLMQQGDLRQALRAMHHAAELEPANMQYRLDLAILYDRMGHAKGAAMLYRQVVQAYDDQDRSLPRALGIDAIRNRAAYLASSDPR